MVCDSVLFQCCDASINIRQYCAVSTSSVLFHGEAKTTFIFLSWAALGETMPHAYDVLISYVNDAQEWDVIQQFGTVLFFKLL